MLANQGIDLNSGTIGGILGGLIPAAAIGIGWAVRTIIKHRKAVARGVLAGLDLQAVNAENSGGEGTLSAAILQFLKQQEMDRQADRQERTRQWERIEEMCHLARDHAQAAWAINTTIQNFGTWIDQAHKHHSDQINEVKNNQILLSNYLRERLGGGGWPSHHARPPQTGN